MLELFYGNYNYSSWSLRPWLLLKHFEIPFTEREVQIGGNGGPANHRAYSPNNLVPCLHDGELQVWDTLAIAEYVAESHPQVWPADRAARAMARSISAEMHSGFGAMRSAMPMNIKLRLNGKPAAPDVQANIDRIVEIWTTAREQYGQQTDQPYLFGAFSVADAMFAPVVWRFNTYNVPLPPVAAAYCDAMRNHPAMKLWEQRALAETVALAYDDLAGSYGGVRG